jgi:hypothetical protein
MSFDNEPTSQALATEIDTHVANHPEMNPSTHMSTNGLEGIPMSLIGMPRVKLVQPVSQNVELATGVDATPGSFFFSDSMTSKPEIRIAIITAKKSEVTFDNDDGPSTVDRIGILFQDLESGKKYLTDLSVTSFSNFGKLMGLMAAEEWENAWDKDIVLSSEKREGKKGKYFVVKFTVGNALSEDKQTELAELWTMFGGYFTREGEIFEEA